MSAIVYFLLFLWSIVQTGVFWFSGYLIYSCITTNSGGLIVCILFFIVANMLIGFLSIFITGQYHSDEEKRFLLKTIINALCASVRLPMHILIRLILLFNSSVPIDWGCFDNDNVISLIIYSATLLDVEPFIGDIPDRVSDHESSPKYIKKARKEIASKKHHAMKPYVEESDGLIHDAADMMSQAKAVAKYCSTFVWEHGNRVDIDLTARLSQNTIYFTINLKRTLRKAFASVDDEESFANQVKYTIESTQKKVFEMMQKWASKNQMTDEYYIDFEKGRWDI